MVEIRFSPQVIDDINNIAEFISRDSEKYASLQTARFFERIEILKTNPLSGRIVPELENPSVRELIIGNYRIIYHVFSSMRVEILTIHHSRRSLKSNPLFE